MVKVIEHLANLAHKALKGKCKYCVHRNSPSNLIHGSKMLADKRLRGEDQLNQEKGEIQIDK